MNIIATQISTSCSNLNVANQSHPILPQNRFLIYHNRSHKLLDTYSIVMIKSTSNYSTIYLDNGEVLFTSKTLKYWEELFNDRSLIRVHRTYLINQLKVLTIQKNKVFLQNNLVAFLSREIKKSIIKVIVK